MDFKPVPLTIEQLSQEHPSYTASAPSWRTIDTLRQGFPAIQKNVHKYLPKRPVEDDELYNLRVAKLCYSPVMSHIVRTYAGKLVGSGVDFPEVTDKVWEELRENNAPPKETKRGELALLSDIFRSLMYFGKCYTVVDMPTAANNARSTFELRASKLNPYYSLLSPLDVINWGDGWYVIRQFVQSTEPFSTAATFALYSYVGKEYTVRYKIPVKLCETVDTQDNLVTQVDKVWHKGEWEKPDETILFDPTEIVQGVGSDRIVETNVSEDEWLCLALYNKQIQHLRIENAWTDAGYLSGTVQRVFTPSDPTVNDDARVSYSNANVQRELEKAGNAHILIGKGYSFVESSGTALGNLEGMLDKIEQQIKVVANLHFASGSKGALQQSGLSKRLDMGLLEGLLQEYGMVVLDTYNNILAVVSKMLGIAPVIVGGLNDYQEKDVELILATITTITPLPDFPPLARQTLYRKLLEESEIVLSPEDDIILTEQLSQITTFVMPTNPVANADITKPLTQSN